MWCCDFGSQTDVIVNTIGDNMNLNQGAVSKALLQAAGPSLQSAVQSESKTSKLQPCDVVITKGFKLSCRKVFHTVCPFWENGKGKAEEVRGFIQRLKPPTTYVAKFCHCQETLKVPATFCSIIWSNAPEP